MGPSGGVAIKASPVTGRESLEGWETSRLPHLPDNRLIDDGEVFSLTRRKRSTPQKYVSASRTHFC
jgi:hypothetical protein